LRFNEIENIKAALFENSLNFGKIAVMGGIKG
jgi:hypothetical protein